MAKKRRHQIFEVDDNMKFLHEKLLHEKYVRQALKKRIYQQRKEFDDLYSQAQQFIQTSDDSTKIQQLLDLLDEEQRSSLMSLYQDKSKSSQQSKKMVNFTTNSFKKYDNVKIVNFVETLQAHHLPHVAFVKEVQNYFNYHAERKQSVIESLRD